MKFVFGVLNTMLMVALLTVNVAAEMPDVLGVQLGMPVRDAHAKLQTALPKHKIQVMSDTLPTIDKPVIKSFSSVPPEQIMMGSEGDEVTVDVTLPPNKQAVWRGKDYRTDWCYGSFNAVYVAAVQSADTPELYSQMRLVAVSLPLALRASEATSKWKKDIAEGQHKQDIEKAKQQEKPKL